MPTGGHGRHEALSCRAARHGDGPDARTPQVIASASADDTLRACRIRGPATTGGAVAQDPGFDATKAHRYFSADCFNKAWELIERTDRTPAEDEQMIRLSHASLWHWTQRDDCTSENISIGYWQASRIHAILGRADDARRYARLCLENTPAESPLLRAYASEALARAENTAGDATRAAQYRGEALRHAEAVTDPADRAQILSDLETIR